MSNSKPTNIFRDIHLGRLAILIHHLKWIFWPIMVVQFPLLKHVSNQKKWPTEPTLEVVFFLPETNLMGTWFVLGRGPQKEGIFIETLLSSNS